MPLRVGTTVCFPLGPAFSFTAGSEYTWVDEVREGIIIALTHCIFLFSRPHVQPPGASLCPLLHQYPRLVRLQVQARVHPQLGSDDLQK